MIKEKSFIVVLLFFYSTFSFSVSNADLYDAIKTYFDNNNFKENFTINKKLNLPSCSKDIEINKKFNSFKTLEIICNQKNNWTYNLRVNIKKLKKTKQNSKKIRYRTVNLLKIKNNIRKGQIITEDDIYYENVRAPGSANYFSKKEEIIGKKAKITIRKGQIARLRHVEKDWTVKEGQKVIIENNSSNIQILVDGIALNSAMKGEYLDVLNKSSGKTLKVWVKNNKKVSIFR